MPALIAAPDAATLEHAVTLLRAGGLVAFPTETVYGLGADARNADAVRRIFAAKERPADHPVIVHLQDASAMVAWARDIPPAAQKLAEAFWPGPLTLILNRAAAVSDVVTGGQPTVGLRVPAHPVAQLLLRAFGGGIAAPSANRFGRISPTAAQHVMDDIGDRLELIVDGGACALGIESTIIACSNETAVLLRPGAIDIEALTRVLGTPPEMGGKDLPRAPGTLAAHYAPRIRSRLLDSRAMLRLLHEQATRRFGVLARTQRQPADFSGCWIDAPDDPAAYAHDLYASLRTLESAAIDMIVIEDVPHDERWRAVRDRVTRATHDVSSPVDELD
ncbi:MAG: L-threonylcarbamoyladenylate synthase [Pseudomonadota bacterium]|nr:L-threonylcarbamoyladenylate synthase [Pseudomonadota bacterium]